MKINRRDTLKFLGAGALTIGLTPLSASVYAMTKRKVFEPVSIGSLKLRNRIVRAATSMEMADINGLPTPELIRVYEDVAKGGAGLVTTGVAYMRKEDQVGAEALGFYDDTQIPAFKELADAIKKHGAKASLQIGFAGSMTISRYKVGEREIWGPSAVEHPWTKVTPKAMTQDDIQAVIKSMAAGALRAKKAGFDAVELHFCHGWLFHQFISPYFNKRSDAYGGSIENRTRLHFAVVEEIRKAVGPDFPVFAKVHIQDEGSQSLAEGVFFIDGLAKQ